MNVNFCISNAKKKKKKYFKYVHKKYIICSRPPSMTFYIHIYDA